MPEKSIFDHIRDRLFWPYERKHNWSDRFEYLMRNRLVVGALRYGRMYDKTRTDRYDHVGDIKRRADLYLKDGNQEHLVDIANLAMFEFARPCSHPDPHWAPSDDGDHTPELDDA